MHLTCEVQARAAPWGLLTKRRKFTLRLMLFAKQT